MEAWKLSGFLLQSQAPTLRTIWQRTSQETLGKSPHPLTSKLRLFLFWPAPTGQENLNGQLWRKSSNWSEGMLASASPQWCVLETGVVFSMATRVLTFGLWFRTGSVSKSWNDVFIVRKVRAHISLSFTSTQTLLLAVTSVNKENPIQGCTDKSPSLS